MGRWENGKGINTKKATKQRFQSACCKSDVELGNVVCDHLSLMSKRKQQTPKQAYNTHSKTPFAPLRLTLDRIWWLFFLLNLSHKQVTLKKLTQTETRSQGGRFRFHTGNLYKMSYLLLMKIFSNTF